MINSRPNVVARAAKVSPAKLAACNILASCVLEGSAVSVLTAASIKHARRRIAARSQRLGRREMV